MNGLKVQHLSKTTKKVTDSDVDVDFEDILAKKTAAPWIPELESDHDTQYFEVSDVVEESGRKDYVPHEGSDWFKDF